MPVQVQLRAATRLAVATLERVLLHLPAVRPQLQPQPLAERMSVAHLQRHPVVPQLPHLVEDLIQEQPLAVHLPVQPHVAVRIVEQPLVVARPDIVEQRPLAVQAVIVADIAEVPVAAAVTPVAVTPVAVIPAEVAEAVTRVADIAVVAVEVAIPAEDIPVVASPVEAAAVAEVTPAVADANIAKPFDNIKSC